MQLLMGVTLLLVTTTPLFAAIAIVVYHLPMVALVTAGGALVAVSVPFVFRWTGSLVWASNLVLGAAVAAIAMSAAVAEGMTAAALPWLIIIPLLAGSIGGSRSGVAWTAVAVGVVVAIFSLERAGVLHPVEMDRALRAEAAAWNVGLLVVGVLVFALVHEATHRRARAALDRARAELDATRAHSEASERLGALGRLVAGVAHEINNPTAFIASNVHFARQVLEGDGAPHDPMIADVVQALGDAHTGAERIARMVRDLQRLGYHAEGTSVVEPRAVLEVSLRIIDNELRHRATLVTSIGSSASVVANEARLGQVFVNLLTNAIDALPADRAVSDNRIEVALRDADDGAWVIVEVRDNGAGIGADVMPRIFDPFFTTKAPNSSSRTPGAARTPGSGAGIGLSLCRRIVEDLGGRLEAESKLGVGSTFRVVLPRAASTTSAAPSTGEAAGPRKLRVLVIDDEPIIGRSLARLLRDHEVEHTTDAAAALVRDDLVRFDVILCDVMMPKMTGVSFYRRIEQRDAGLAARVGFMSGGAFFDDPTGADHELVRARLLHKPFTRESVDEFLRRLLSEPSGL